MKITHIEVIPLIGSHFIKRVQVLLRFMPLRPTAIDSGSGEWDDFDMRDLHATISLLKLKLPSQQKTRESVVGRDAPASQPVRNSSVATVGNLLSDLPVRDILPPFDPPGR